MEEKALLEQAKECQRQMLADRRYLHKHAETGFDLEDTVAYVAQRLTDMGYSPEKCEKKETSKVPMPAFLTPSLKPGG